MLRQIGLVLIAMGCLIAVIIAIMFFFIQYLVKSGVIVQQDNVALIQGISLSGMFVICGVLLWFLGKK